MTPAIRHGRLATFTRAATPLLPVAALISILLRFPPEQNTFYPRCPIYTGLHLLCPGCGGTRALASLLHGHLHEALHDNALITLLAPITLIYGAAAWLRFLQSRPSHWPQIPPAVIHAAFIVTTIFTLLRNLP